MPEERTTIAIQRYLDALALDTLARHASADQIIRELLERAAGRLRLLCARLLHKSYPRLARPPMNLESDEILGAVVARLLTTLQTIRPTTVRQFFGLANQHMRWQLNDLARRLDVHPIAVPLSDVIVAAPMDDTDSGLTPPVCRILGAIDRLPEIEREVFELIGLQGLTHAEVAKVTGVSEKTVQRRLRHARLLLAERLADLCPASPVEDLEPAPEKNAY